MLGVVVLYQLGVCTLPSSLKCRLNETYSLYHSSETTKCILLVLYTKRLDTCTTYKKKISILNKSY